MRDRLRLDRRHGGRDIPGVKRVGNQVAGSKEPADYDDDPASAYIRMISGAVAGCTACVACYPVDLIRTRLTTELPGKEHYKGIADAFTKIIQTEGLSGLYAGLGPTLFVAVPNWTCVSEA